MPSGEALVRQILYGKRYFLDKFGVDVKVGWLPDTFGFCWTLPQILKGCGIDYFLTSKLNWETTLPFPYSVFWWQAPDGSKILACETVGGYNHTSLRSLTGELKFLMRHQGINSLLFVYGCGDHGGGPTIELIEEILKLRSQKSSLEVLFSRAEDYFHRLKKINQEGNDFPMVNDELYLKTHRGTYTTQAKVKLNNRRAECLLRNAEKFACIADRYGLEYPQKRLEEAWKKLLFNQFHDILAGSSIEKVYEDAQEDYDEVFKAGEETLFSSLRQIAKNMNTEGEGKTILVFNPLCWERDGLVRISPSFPGNPESIRILNERGEKVPCQIVEEEGKKLIFIARDIPSLGYEGYRAVPIREKEHFSTDVSTAHNKESLTLENKFYTISIGARSGLLTSIYDKLNKMEILDESKKGGIFQIYEDFSLRESAWNIWLGALTELNKADEVSVVEEGPVRVAARIKHTYKQEERPDSTFIQEVRLYSEVPLIEFRVDVDWHTRHRMLKVAFPLNLHSEETTYDIPYGTIKRKDPAAPSANSVDRTKWEVAALKWMDYTDEKENYGVSLISECKYGFDLKDGVMRMSLLRSPDYPDPLMMGLSETAPSITDQGRHSFSYALYPHKSSWKRAGTMRKGYEFNFSPLPILESAHRGDLPRRFSFVRISPENVILETMKKAEDSALS